MIDPNMFNNVSESDALMFDTAWNVADHYMTAALNAIDDKFGEGYAAENPELLAAFMNLSGGDYNSATIRAVLMDIRDALRDLAGRRSA